MAEYIMGKSTAAVDEYLYESLRGNPGHRWLLPVVQDLTKDIPRGARVIDLGCGNAAFLAKFLERSWELHGIDNSGSGIDLAKAAYPSISFTLGDLAADMSSHSLAGKCDLVLSTEVVEHVFLPRIYARNCWHMLKPGGELIITTPYYGYLRNVVLAIAGRMDDHFTALWDYGHIKFWSRRTLTALLEGAGFRVTHFRGAGRKIPYLWRTMILRAVKTP